ncbi:MAG: serine/threonine protein kinase [Planctomycetes bacterium]|nr:serine/threonine protein kinase [Planctomycetota bacterium]
MSELSPPCACGSTVEVTTVEVVQTTRCPRCAAEGVARRAYALGKGELPPDLTPLRNLARRQLSTNDTVDLGPLGAPAAVTRPPPLAAEESEPFIHFEDSGSIGLPRRAPDATARVEEPSAPILPVNTPLGVYRILAVLGQGGMGVVYKAHDTSLDRFVALKVLNPDLCKNQQFIERFEREAKACAALSHPNITHIYAIDRQRHYFVMELVEGENLADLVKRVGPLPVTRAIDCTRQAARGLRAGAALGIIHRDIKPSNLLVSAEGQVKITDFGLAKAFIDRNPGLTSTGVVMGTPLFMSPEQGRGSPIDARSDIYSLGATLFFMLYGCPPHEADSPIAIILKHLSDPVTFPERADVPEGVKALVARMMEKDVGRRVADYDALLADLDRLDRGEALAAETPRRVVVLQPRPTTRTRSMFKAGKLSVARTNLKLGRKDKAVSLLEEALADGDPALRTEAATLLIEIYEEQQDVDGVRRMAEAILQDPKDPALGAFASWKLAALEERAALAAVKRALARYEAILKEPPDDLPRAVIEQQVKRLRANLVQTEREAGATQVLLGTKTPV